uniref:Uncharacterized protein n=1 Tax=Megaselia scalaris TaxID=36166 RepID=T1GW34_MEGSC
MLGNDCLNPKFQNLFSIEDFFKKLRNKMTSLLKVNNKKDHEQPTDDECYGFEESTSTADLETTNQDSSTEIIPFKKESPKIEYINFSVEPFMQTRAKIHNLIYYELTTFKELGTCNYDYIRKLLNCKTTEGISRDGWKTLCWLNSSLENLPFKPIKVDGELVKLPGCKGDVPAEIEFNNYNSKVTRFTKNSKLIKYNSAKNQKVSEMKDIVIVNRKSSIDNILAPKRKYRLTQLRPNKVVNHKPGPLFSKIKSYPPHPFMEKPEIFEMPEVKLEVFPAVNKPLDNDIKCYLKYIQPSESITREWAEFSVSTLVDKFKAGEDKKSFEFKIPYVHNQRHVLVRRRKRLENSGMDKRAFKNNSEGYKFSKLKWSMIA